MFWHSRSAEQDRLTCLITADKNITYHDLFSDADQLFDGLDRSLVVILCTRSYETVACYVGALRRNLVPFLLDETIKPAPLQNCISAYAPQYVFAHKTVALPNYRPFRTFNDHVLFQRNEIQNNQLNENLALLLPTSGSTGDPKCVRLSRDNIDICTKAIVNYLKLQSQHISISLLPFHYSYGLSILHNVMQTRSSLVLTDLSVLDRPFWSLLETHKVTEFSAVPTIFEMIRRMRLSKTILDNLRCVTQAGGRLDPKFTKHFHQLFSQSDIAYFTMYGQTEAAPRISYVPPNLASEKLGSVGIPIACGDIYLQKERADAEEGELIYKGPNVCLGYANNAADLALGDENKGLLKTGDLARIDEDGFIFLVGRLKRFIKLQGISANLDHIENTIKSNGIDCMVIGKDNRLLICFMGDKSATIANIVDQNFHFHASNITYQQMADLPKTASGKPDYSKLVANYL